MSPRATPDHPIPTRLTVSIGGYPGPWYTLRLSRRTLWYEARPSVESETTKEKVPVTPEGWKAFGDALDEIKIWRWRSDYENPGVCDGTSWSVEIALGDRHVASGGSNNYPLAGGRPKGSPDPTPSFQRLLAAVRALVGGREFC